MLLLWIPRVKIACYEKIDIMKPDKKWQESNYKTSKFEM